MLYLLLLENHFLKIPEGRREGKTDEETKYIWLLLSEKELKESSCIKITTFDAS